MTPITPAVSGPVWPPDVLVHDLDLLGFSLVQHVGLICVRRCKLRQATVSLPRSKPATVRTQMKSRSHPVRWGKLKYNEWGHAQYIKWDTAERCTPNMTWLLMSSGGKWQLRDGKQHSRFSDVFKLSLCQWSCENGTTHDSQNGKLVVLTY